MLSKKSLFLILAVKVLKTIIAEFENAEDQDGTAHNEPSHLDLQCLPSRR